MKITQDVRDYAASLGDNEKAALYPVAAKHQANGAAGATEPSYRDKGMAEMSKRFNDMGGEVYVEADKVKESNKVL
jgi:phosphomethylpyrimidine synthase